MADLTFYSNGKLLLTGEYVVLDGATALAFPTTFGQRLTVAETNSNVLIWRSLNHEQTCWFEAKFSLDSLNTAGTDQTSITLQNILQKARELNPSFLKDSSGLEVGTQLDFPRNWGLGTSSTLINNIAQWANVDAFTLLQESFGGSGYDIAAAQHTKSILYQRGLPPTIREVHLPWEFKEQLFFVHLNQKQDSKEGIERYRAQNVSPQMIEKISDLSNKLLLCYDLDSFKKVLQSHEQLISKTLDLSAVKERLFPNYKGTIKSLGAWGGDFVLVTGTYEDMNYFREKGYNTILSFEEMIK